MGVLIKLLILLIEIFAISNCKNEKCALTYPPFVEIPPELSKIAGRTDAFAQTVERYEYTVNPGTKSFTINCTCPNPVLWKVYLNKVYLKSKVEFYSEVSDVVQEDNTTKTTYCHTVSLTILEVSEDITGYYTCDIVNDPFGDLSTYLSPPKIFIYGEPDPASQGLFLHRGKTINNTIVRDYEVKIEDDFELVIPCNTNYPTNLSVTISSWEGNQETIDVPTHTCSKYPSPCVQLGNNTSPGFNFTKLMLRKGSQIQCKTETNGNESAKNIVYIDVTPSKDTVYEPKEQNKTLWVEGHEEFTFQCKSIHPIKINHIKRNIEK